MDAP
jgi:hypothetical protein